jgi:DNA mismatch repair protein MutL
LKTLLSPEPVTMAITALPQATIHLLGSAQVLTTPSSLVKELIDNALDAKATSIDILIAKNTLDKLEVRDNGHGISSEDFNSLGKRGHTSKLRTFEELRFIGGVTLGFRGEALASAVQLGEVTVTTKAEGEPVGTKLVLKAPGGVHQQTRASHPVGTTVSVLKFMHKLPVRKKTYEKEAPKTLAKITQLLRAYALARPSIKFSLKIAGGAKGSWSFAPRPNEGIREVVSQVIGRDASMECFEKSMSSSETPSKVTPHVDEPSEYGSQGGSRISGEHFEIEAFLPKPDANPSKIGTGQFLSIDSRPVSHEKGTMRKIVTTFKKYIRSGLAQDSDKLKNPFIRLNLKCPLASYDANVEPAKDDVLFGNESVVLDLVEALLKEVYGELQALPAPREKAQRVDDFDLLLAIPTPTPRPLQQTAVGVSPSQGQAGLSSLKTIQASSTPMKNPTMSSEDTVTEEDMIESGGTSTDHRKWGFDMSKDFSEAVDGCHQVHRSSRTYRPIVPPTSDPETTANPLNPWIIAKMTAPLRQNRASSEPRRTFDETHLNIPIHEESHHDQREEDLARPNPRLRQTFQSDDIRAIQPHVSRQYPIVRRRSLGDDELNVERDFTPQPRRRNDFISARNVPENALISPPATDAPRRPPRSRGPNKPYVSPLIAGSNREAPADRMVQTTLFDSNPRPRRQSDGGRVMLQNEPNPDLAWAMDYEQRKQDTTRRRREDLYAAQIQTGFSTSGAPPRASPHKNRYNAAVASLEVGPVAQPSAEPPEQLKQPWKTTLPDGDPRAFLMKRQKSHAAKKGSSNQRATSRSMSRAKSRLPLEKIPIEQLLHNLVYTMDIDKGSFKGAMEKLAVTDMYVSHGGQSGGLIMKHAELGPIALKIKGVVNLWMKTEEGRECEVEFQFENLLTSKSAQL